MWKLTACLALVVLACSDGSTSSQFLEVYIETESYPYPPDPAVPHQIYVVTNLVTNVNYANLSASRAALTSRPVGGRSPASSSETRSPVDPDGCTFLLNGQIVASRCGLSWDPAQHPDGPYHFEARVTYRELSASNTLDWTLDTRPATFVPLGSALPIAGYGKASAGSDVAVGFGAQGEPMVLAGLLADPSSHPELGLAVWDGGSWGVMPLGTGDGLHPTLGTGRDGMVWAAWDEPGGVTANRSDAGDWERVATGLPAQQLQPRLAIHGEEALLGLADQAVPVRRFADGGWAPAAEALPAVPASVRLLPLDAGELVLALEPESRDSVQVLHSSSGGAWQPLGAPLVVGVADGGPAPHLIDLVAGADGAPVLALTRSRPAILVYRWSGTTWEALGAPIAYLDEYLGYGAPFPFDRPQAALAAVPDGGLAVLYLTANGSLNLDGWNGTSWQRVAGPLRATVGTASVYLPALTFDADGGPLAAWRQSNRYRDSLIVWRP